MEAAIRKAVEPNPPTPAPKPISEPKPQVRLRLSELRTLGKYNIMWVKKVVVEWDMKAIPWQVWVGMMFLYATIILLRSRSRNSKPISLVNVD